MSVNVGEGGGLDNDQLKLCRICFDHENAEDIISPCLCSGGSAFVHRTCLNRWRSENVGGKGFKICNVCQFEYVIEPVSSDVKAERQRRMKYYFFVTRDAMAAFILVQLVVGCFAFLLKAVDKNEKNIKQTFPASVPESIMYYISALVLLLAIVGLIACIVAYCASSSRGGPGDCRSCSGRKFHFAIAAQIDDSFFVVVTLLLIFAVIGLLVGIGLSVISIQTLMKHHASKLWLRQEAEKYTVKDFQGRRGDLEKYKNPVLFSQ
jgi:uncharacterized membrane protein